MFSNLQPPATAHKVGAMILHGYKIIESSHMVVPGPDEQRRRSWRERLLTRPWRPWQSHKTVKTTVPDTNVIVMGHTLYMHPQTAARLRAELQTKEP